MKILYYSPNCGSGIEQIGFIYLLLLKSLGYNIDLINTQCCKLQKTIIKDIIFSNNYDYIILNEMHNLFFERIEHRKCNQKIFNIVPMILIKKHSKIVHIMIHNWVNMFE